MTPRHIRKVVVGDIHGELSGLTDILHNAGLIDAHDAWKARDTILIQTGDVIDRGPHSRGAVAFLRTLQQQAAAFSSQVVRCFGNHELMLLQDHYAHANFSDPGALANEFRREIARGLLQAAYTDGHRLYTHAGLRTAVHDRVVEDMTRTHPSRKGKPVRVRALVDHINAVVAAAVAADACDARDHCLFWIDHARGGRDAVGGIFWCDYPAIAGSELAPRIPQVFGHTPSRRNDLTHARGLRLINVDAGMCAVYGGQRVYLEIAADGTLVQHSKDRGHWSERILGREDFQPSTAS